MDHHQHAAREGHFYYRDLGWIKVKTPMLHWRQGTLFKALAHLHSASAVKVRRLEGQHFQRGTDAIQTCDFVLSGQLYADRTRTDPRSE